jgi:TatD DNase family protein
MIIDTHAHLDFKNFRKDLPAVLERAHVAGVGAVVTIGISVETSRKAIGIAREYENVFATVGIHPHEADSATDEAVTEIEKLAADKKVVAVGECGLDYVRSETTKEDQHNAFYKQMELAEKLGIPVVVHVRDAYGDALKVLDSYRGRVRGIIHCMSGDAAFRDAALGLGYCIAVGGPVTYTGNDELRRVMAGVPLDRLLLETDCPFLVPQSRRPGRNEPAYLDEVAGVLAKLHGVSAEEIARRTTANAIRVLGLPLDAPGAQAGGA